MSTAGSTTPPKRRYVQALDLVRALTICSVIAVHSTWFTANGGTSVAAGAVSSILHFTRESFMALSGFVLTYSVWKKPIKWGGFWAKRYRLVFFPYVIWSFLYLVFFHPVTSLSSFLQTFGFDLLTGQAWFHMYYLLITMQFYLLMPIFYRLMQKAEKHPWIVLGGAFVFEVLLMSYDQYGVRGAAHGLNAYTTIEVWTYTLYLVLGGVAAVHWEAIRDWLQSHRALVFGLSALTAGGMLAAYFIQLAISHDQMWAYSVLQPAMVPWSVMSIVLLATLGIGYENRRAVRPTYWQSIKVIADLSFGIYLFHPMLLNEWMWFLGVIGVHARSFWLDGLTVAVLISGSTLVISLIARTPVSAYLIGRAKLPPRKGSSPLSIHMRSQESPSRG